MNSFKGNMINDNESDQFLTAYHDIKINNTKRRRNVGVHFVRIYTMLHNALHHCSYTLLEKGKHFFKDVFYNTVMAD